MGGAVDMAGGRDGAGDGVLHLAGDLVGLCQGDGPVEAAFGSRAATSSANRS